MKHFTTMGEIERIFLKEFCRAYNFIPISLTDAKSKEPYEGILSAETGAKILVEVKIRNEKEYDEGILIEKNKYENILRHKKLLKCDQVFYISVFHNVITIVKVDKIDPVWFEKLLPISFLDRTLINKKIAYISEYIRIEDEMLLAFIYNLKSKNK